MTALVLLAVLTAQPSAAQDNLRWMHADLATVSSEPRRTVERLVDAARAQGGAGMAAPFLLGEETVHVAHLVLPKRGLARFAASMKRIDPSLAERLSTEGGASTAAVRLHELTGEARALEPFQLAMPFTAAVLQQEIDALARQVRGHDAYTAPVFRVTVAVGPPASDRHNLKSASTRARDYPPSDVVAMLEAYSADSGDPARPEVSETARKTAESWSPLDRLRCSAGAATVFHVDRLTTKLDARYIRRKVDTDCIPPHLFHIPDVGSGSPTGFLLPADDTEALEAWLREHSLEFHRQDTTMDPGHGGSGVDDGPSARATPGAEAVWRSRLAELQAEASEQSDFLATRPALKKLVAGTIRKWERALATADEAKGSRMVVLLVNGR